MSESINNVNRNIDKWLNRGDKRGVWIFVILLSVLLVIATIADQIIYNATMPPLVSSEEFQADLEAGNIDTLYYSSQQEMMRYTLFNDETRNMTVEQREKYHYSADQWRRTLYPSGETFREDMLYKYKVNLRLKAFEPLLSGFWSVFIMFLGIGLLFLALIKLSSSGVSVGKKFSSIMSNEITTKFKDVIGQDEVLDDLRFIVEMMHGKKIDALGARIPKGILLSGPPGTGKTLIARAVAGEANVPFFSANASEFIDMYVGVGPKTVRTLFAQARRHKPCIIFIDEIDAVASKRNATGTTSEDNKTVNALLQEMDGFNKEDGVFVIAATNNPDNLDSAIVRAGRFDRQIVVNPPRDWTVRQKLLERYIGDTPCEANIENIARQTVGFTGADINMLVNEARLIASMDNKTQLDMECFEKAIDKKVFKANRTSNAEKHNNDINLVAYHEAGHAVMTYLAGLPIARASIIGSTSGVGGAVFQSDKDTGQFMTRSEYEWQIKICFAGRASEKIKFNDVSDGASSDIKQATNYIYAYICKVGMDSEFGMLDIDVLKQNTPFAVPVEAMRALANRLMDEATKILESNYDMVEIIAKALLEKETISGDEIKELLDGSKTSNKA